VAPTAAKAAMVTAAAMSERVRFARIREPPSEGVGACP
jgi:hypothetical protein